MKDEFLMESFSDFVTNKKAEALNESDELREDDHRSGDKVTLKDGTSGTIQSWDDNEGVYIVLLDAGETREITDAELSEAKEIIQLEEADVKDKASLKAFVHAMYKEAFADKFDEKKANDVVDGLVKKYKDDWGAMVGAAKSSLG